MERLVLDARLRLLPTDHGGRSGPVFGDYRPSWNLGNTWLGEPTINDGRVLLDPEARLEPGDEALVRIQPLAPEFWGQSRVGLVIAMQEGARVVGYASILGFAERPSWFSSEAAGFVNEALQFCEFADKSSGLSLDQLLVTSRERLLRLYEAGSTLPRVEPPEGYDSELRPNPPEGLKAFGNFEHYWEVVDPYAQESAVCGSLSDDLLDVYADVKRGVWLWERNCVPKAAAIWEWRFHFEQHWGAHAIDALRALHYACERLRSGSRGQLP